MFADLFSEKVPPLSCSFFILQLEFWRVDFIQTVDYPEPVHERYFFSLLQKYFLQAFLSEKAHHVLRSTPSAQSETTGNER